MKKESRRNMYIGHRYVPKIMGEWDKRYQYEGLSIVTYKGASYTSKKRVPIGIDISNEEYWVLTGNYNAQIEHYRQEVSQSKSDILENKSKIETNELKTLNNKNKINHLNSIIKNINDYPRYENETDDAPRINRALQSLENNEILYLVPNETYDIKTEDIKIISNLNGQGSIFNIHNNNKILIGYEDNKTRLENVEIKMPDIYQLNKDWETENTGIIVSNVYSSRIYFNIVSNFKTGILFTAYGTGNAYNEFNIGHLLNNRINLLIEPNESGWVNENNFYGGRYSHLSSENQKTPDTRHISISTKKSDHTPNNNAFYKPSVEGNVSEYVIYCEGHFNTFYTPRFEGSNLKVVFDGVGGHSNIIFYGYNTHIVEVIEQNNAKYNSMLTRSSNILNGSSSKHGILSVRNMTSNNNPLLSGFSSSINPYKADKNDYSISISSNKTKMKRSNDLHPRIMFDHSLGEILTGNGLEEPKRFISNNQIIFGENNDKMFRLYGNRVRYEGSDFEISNGGYNTGHLMLGDTHIWVDETGNLRVKKGVPTSDTDGKIITTE